MDAASPAEAIADSDALRGFVKTGEALPNSFCLLPFDFCFLPFSSVSLENRFLWSRLGLAVVIVFPKAAAARRLNAKNISRTNLEIGLRADRQEPARAKQRIPSGPAASRRLAGRKDRARGDPTAA